MNFKYAYVFHVEADWSDITWDCDHIDLLWIRPDGKYGIITDKETRVFNKGIYQTPEKWEELLTDNLLYRIGYNFRFMRNAELMRRDGSGYAVPIMRADKVVWDEKNQEFKWKSNIKLPDSKKWFGGITYEHLDDDEINIDDEYTSLLCNIIINLSKYDQNQ